MSLPLWTYHFREINERGGIVRRLATVRVDHQLSDEEGMALYRRIASEAFLELHRVLMLSPESCEAPR